MKGATSISSFTPKRCRSYTRVRSSALASERLKSMKRCVPKPRSDRSPPSEESSQKGVSRSPLV